MMTTTTTGAKVISLQSHPAWRSARRRSRELADAMRRHPSYQGGLRPDGHGGDGPAAGAVDRAAVVSIGAR